MNGVSQRVSERHRMKRDSAQMLLESLQLACR